MKTSGHNQTLKSLGEAGIIQLIQACGPAGLASHIRKGIGDDCAVLETGGKRCLLVTTDTLIEGIHFTEQTLPPEALGWKALAVNMSDIAAMGGTPRTAFLSMGLKPEASISFLESFMAGFKALADETAIALAGGDTVESPSLIAITVMLLGDCPPENVVYRSGARVGDDLWVTGPLGNAAGGLFLLREGLSSEPSAYASLIQAHQRPLPRLGVGKALGESGLVHAMIDISDGIAKDLGHICEQSDTGALLQASSIPLSGDLLRLAADAKKSPLDWALHGGEDYELLFAASSSDQEKIVSLTTKVSDSPPTKIGSIIQEDGIWLDKEAGRERLRSGGYIHFSQ
ncbi:MAG: thiamine-phosphate kinase [Deltaproteobacteria bacterium]